MLSGKNQRKILHLKSQLRNLVNQPTNNHMIYVSEIAFYGVPWGYFTQSQNLLTCVKTMLCFVGRVCKNSGLGEETFLLYLLFPTRFCTWIISILRPGLHDCQTLTNWFLSSVCIKNSHLPQCHKHNGPRCGSLLVRMSTLTLNYFWMYVYITLWEMCTIKMFVFA